MPQNTPIAPVNPINLEKYGIIEKNMCHYGTDVTMQIHLPQ